MIAKVFNTYSYTSPGAIDSLVPHFPVNSLEDDTPAAISLRKMTALRASVKKLVISVFIIFFLFSLTF